MAFGITRHELQVWKNEVASGKVAFLTHYWQDDRFPECYTVTKVGCNNKEKLLKWGAQYGLKPEWIDDHPGLPHFDLLGERQVAILQQENEYEQLRKLIQRKKAGSLK
ncbi:hypothetical protein A374_04784 [Fictibacillus macauensis ZFHKF-1]|uniref:YneQ n=1 Tax=Fictibacillus macauensis ZFHKF-1 TaxID=1196324 RepID=I8J4X8_9BACL|nr:hypothetical protein [Fictibacillus macauensis]EIT86861.1 hypothetical protein A374_04784 [Fictibacillus macauensis ZFHKF-1]